MSDTKNARMISFRRITAEDKPLYDSYLASEGERGCEFSFANLYLWGRQNISLQDDTVIIFSQFNRRSVYPYPLGRDLKSAIDAIIADSAARGAIPQDLKFIGEETTAVIGNNTTIRECVTINRGTASKGTTIVGNYCLIMAYAHVAHDCKLGDRIILGNTTQLAGEVVVDDWAIVSGGTLVHQFCHLGAHIMVQGGSKITKDIPPYMMVGREPLGYMGLNIVGLRRRGFIAEQMNAIQESYRYVYLSGLNTTQALEAIEKNIPKSKEREDIVSFIRSSERGIIK